MSIPSIGSGTTPLTVLAQTAANAVALSQKVELDQIDGRMNKQLKQKVAALQNTGDTPLIQGRQAQIAQLQKQNTAISQLQAQYSNNSDTLSAIQTQLADLQASAATGDSTNFDKTLAVANDYLDNLIAVSPTAPFQPDGVLGLKGTGFGIGNSASYDLSTPAGQSAAETAVGNAQALINQIFAPTTSNILVAGSLSTVLAGQINSINGALQATEQNDQNEIATKTQTLTQQNSDVEHLIQLALADATQTATQLAQDLNPPAAPKSVFGVLTGAVGATASSYSSTGSTPPILSLFA